MAVIDDATRAKLRERLGGLEGQVELRLYRKPDTGRLILPDGFGCATCGPAEELVRAIAEAAPDRVSVEVSDVGAASGDVPTITVGAPGEDARITFQGLPAGYEFATLLDAVERTSQRSGALAAELETKVATLTDDVEIMVFVTPTCPYCPAAASMANRMALTSPKVRSLIVEANEFPALSRRFEVQGVPRTVVNRSGSFVGALPETPFVESVVQLATVETG